MNDTIKDIFNNNIKLLEYADKTIEYLRIQNYYKALAFSFKTIDILMKAADNIIKNHEYFIDAINANDFDNLNPMLKEIAEALENKDYILLSDLLEARLIPFILNLQEAIIIKEEPDIDQEIYQKNLDLLMLNNNDLVKLIQQQEKRPLQEKEYNIEYSSCGLFTLAAVNEGKKYYFHSNNLVMKEAGILAREWFSNDISEYLIYGIGLGYHIKELFELDDSITIKVFESNLEVIRLAFTYSDLSSILSSERVRIIYDPSFMHMMSSIRNIGIDSKFIIHYPSLRNIKNNMIKEELEEYFVYYSSVNNQLHNLNNNFKKNIVKYDGYIDALKDKFKNKDLFIIAAGPSLDKNYMELKNTGSNAVILSTGTVLKKLVEAGIKPDYVIIIDANDGVQKQITGLEQSDIPLLFLSTVNYRVPEMYQGKKYIICQQGFNHAEEFADKRDYSLYQTGGSVTTTALDIGIRFGCKRIIFVGLDLAFTNNMDHAAGTEIVNKVSSDNFRRIEDIYGNNVITGINLDMYKKWIEKRIKEVNSIEFIDATEGGARIAGTKIEKLNEVIKRIS